jgi:DNA polymerase
MACRGCELYQRATQVVFSSGPARARVLLVGEQPGDIEDREGQPFIGPAGRLLDRALADAGIDRDAVYLTNAVKHFRWKPTASAKRRIHDQPAARHVTACLPWLEAELGVVRPQVIVALGAIAARALLGTAFRLSHHRGEVLGWPPPSGPFAGSDLPVSAVVATNHPSAVLRSRGSDRTPMYDGLVSDLRLAVGQEYA